MRKTASIIAVVSLSLELLSCAGGTDGGVANTWEKRTAEVCACTDMKCVGAVEKKYETTLDPTSVPKLKGDARKRALAAISKAIDCAVRIGLRDPAVKLEPE